MEKWIVYYFTGSTPMIWTREVEGYDISAAYNEAMSRGIMSNSIIAIKLKSITEC